MKIVFPSLKKMGDVRIHVFGERVVIQMIDAIIHFTNNITILSDLMSELKMRIDIRPCILLNEHVVPLPAPLTPLLFSYYLAGYCSDSFYKGRLGCTRECPQYDRCRIVFNEVEKVIKASIKYIIDNYYEEISKFRSYREVPFADNEKIIIPLKCLFCPYFPVLIVCLILFHQLVKSKEISEHSPNCLVPKIIIGNHCYEYISKEEWRKWISKAYENGEFELNFLKKYLCNTCWKNLVKIFHLDEK